MPCQQIFRGVCILLLRYCKITDTMGKVLLISSESDFMRDVYLTSNKVHLQKYLIIKCSGKRHLLDL